MNTNEIVGIGVMILCGVVLVVQILGLLLSIFKKMTTPKVETLKARKDIKGLIKALRYRKDKGVRASAAEALVKIGAPAVEPLIAALKDKDSDVRYAAAKALGEIKDPRAVEPLIAALKDESSSVRRAAAEALGKIGDPRAVEPLIAVPKDYYSGVRYAVTKALVKIGAPAVEPLIAALKDKDSKDSDVRQAAAEALGEIKDPRAVEPLIAALKDGDSDVRKAAAKALGEIKDPRAVEPLIAALKDAKWRVREAAAEALVSLYRNASLSETAKQTILAHRSKITSPHSDGSSCGDHDDNGGIGVDFPL